MAFLTLMAGTLVSEDLTCVAAGALVRQGAIDPLAAVAACALGIYAGDLGLWAAGRLWRTRVQRAFPGGRPATPTLILLSRVLPGTRLPLYLADGALGGSFGRFAWWTLVAVALWTPALVLLSVHYAVAMVALLVAWRLGVALATRRGRQRTWAALSRVWRWEFWPMWLFYAPVAPWVAMLAVRHRGFGVVSAANPGMPDGGIVGESKFDILRRLPAQWTIPSLRVSPGGIEMRLWEVVDHYSRNQWGLPLVLKPDVGQRGAGVKIARTLADVRDYLSRELGAVLVQPYHPGPFEAGVFYYRLPGAARGRILSITDKHFPVAIGDGRSTLEDLIWADPRLRMQAATFLARHASRRTRVLAAGERFPLAIAGNHAQGTLFRDGRHLITPALEARIDEIAQQYPGFYIGRFDIRYRDVEAFTAGEDLAIVELNGATGESTNIYDPAGSLLSAYRQLFRQWSLVFAIGAANQAAGAAASSPRRLAALMRAHWSTRVAYETSD